MNRRRWPEKMGCDFRCADPGSRHTHRTLTSRFSPTPLRTRAQSFCYSRPALSQPPTPLVLKGYSDENVNFSTYDLHKFGFHSSSSDQRAQQREFES